jgi:glycosyltransferase involved in cell wall biosynthesis
MPSAPPRITVVATVLNEEQSVSRLLASLSAQTRPPDEIVVCDGGSRDGTVEALRQGAAGTGLPITIIERSGANISTGRNAAIGVASGPIIACTDAGVRLVPEWLGAISAPFADGARAVSGFFASDPTGAFETALGATTLPDVSEIDPLRFLPSSRSVAFLKDDWAAVGGYPEWLDFGEDLVFDMRLLHQTGGAAFVPAALARFRPRPSLRAFARQYYLYARGDGKALLWPWRHAIRYATYLGVVPLLAALAVWHHPLWIAVLAAGLVWEIRSPIRRLRRQWTGLGTLSRLAALAWVPVIRVTGDVAKMLGFPVGLQWRRVNKPPEWRPDPRVGRR